MLHFLFDADITVFYTVCRQGHPAAIAAAGGHHDAESARAREGDDRGASVRDEAQAARGGGRAGERGKREIEIVATSYCALLTQLTCCR